MSDPFHAQLWRLHDYQRTGAGPGVTTIPGRSLVVPWPVYDAAGVNGG
jgi:hypothetical protein